MSVEPRRVHVVNGKAQVRPDTVLCPDGPTIQSPRQADQHMEKAALTAAVAVERALQRLRIQGFSVQRPGTAGR
jgi:hypothetical protein